MAASMMFERESVSEVVMRGSRMSSLLRSLEAEYGLLYYGSSNDMIVESDGVT